eukprot:GHRR01025484.1.p1 GENE.GHRR01025484.1~~GHRR01025484.1.p1  ORF type:complete len:103 (+),score=12.98 GHRR01025484.1:37-345(+)
MNSWQQACDTGGYPGAAATAAGAGPEQSEYETPLSSGTTPEPEIGSEGKWPLSKYQFSRSIAFVQHPLHATPTCCTRAQCSFSHAGYSRDHFVKVCYDCFKV